MALSRMQLSDLRLAAQRRADMESSNFLSTSEWNDNINASLTELYDLLIEKFGNHYFVATPYQFTTDGTSQLFSLPLDFYKCLGVDVSTQGGITKWATMKPMNWGQRNEYAAPAAGRGIQLWYAPRFAELVNDTDTADGVDGWLEYVVIDAAIKALTKEESDTSVLEARKDKLVGRIESAAENRDAGFPATVTDVYAISSSNAPTLRYRLMGSQLWLGESYAF